MIVYVARQPIFDRRQKVYAYELLYRSGEENYNTEQDYNRATAEVIANSFLAIGLEKLTRRKKAFINFSLKLLEEEAARMLPSSLVAVELNGSIKEEEKAAACCSSLQDAGYSVVFDDFKLENKASPILKTAEMVKVDYRSTDVQERALILELFRGKGKKLIAERIETVQEYGDAMANGYDYFQGYFFCEPTVISGKDIQGTKLHNLRLLQEIYKSEMDFDQVETLIKQDPALSYKLLRFINSIAFAVRFPIRSIRQAMALLGQKEIIKWASLVALRNVGYDKPDELLVTAVSRAKFCESMAVAVNIADRSADLFLTGLFSLLDTFLDQPMEEVLKELPLDEEIKNALYGRPGLFRDILELVFYYEKGEWDKVFTITSQKYGLDDVDVMSYYLESLELADIAWQ